MSSSAGSFARRCWFTLRHDGPVAFCGKAVRRVGARLVRTNAADWYRADLTRGCPTFPAPPGAGISFTETEEVVRWLGDLQPEFGWVWVDAELEAARRFGHVFPLVRIEGKRAGYIKVGLSRAYVGDFERTIAIPPATAFIYDSFVHPDYRGRGLARWAIARTLEFLAEHDITSVWCHIPAWNRASIRAYAGCGFEKVGHIRYVRALGYGWYTHHPERLLERNRPAAGGAAATLP